MLDQTLRDPRPRARDTARGWLVDGQRCASCDRAVATERPRCPTCHSSLHQADFGPEGTVWATTVVRVPVSGMTPPYGLAYLDLDDGPRVLAHMRPGEVSAGERARITGVDDAGNLRIGAT